MAFKLTPGNTDARQPVPDMTQDIIGKLFGDRGYISQELFEKLYEQGLQLITRHKKNMKQKLVKLIDKILLRKRSLIETVNDQLKNISQIEHSLASECLELYGQSLCGVDCLYLFTAKTFSRS